MHSKLVMALASEQYSPFDRALLVGLKEDAPSIYTLKPVQVVQKGSLVTPIRALPSHSVV
jgi:hypothetical protein